MTTGSDNSSQLQAKVATPTISAFIVCCNEEHQIRRCLQSILWCDEIIVVDSGSKDRTLEICREYNTKIFERPWPGFVAQKRFALEQCSGEWVLNIDADEEVSPALAREIKLRVEGAKLATPPIEGFQLLRVVYHWGRFWRRGGWYPEFRLRVCHKSATIWGGIDPHDKAEVKGRSERLLGELYHYTYDDVAYQIRSLNSHSSAAAKSMFDSGTRATIVNILGNPIVRFLKFYLFKRGFREGAAGLYVAILDSFYVFLKYVKLWELQKAFPKGSVAHPVENMTQRSVGAVMSHTSAATATDKKSV